MKNYYYVKVLFIGLSLVFSASSCVQTKRISKRNIFYKLDMTNGSNILHRYEVKKAFKGSIIDKGGYITIVPDSAAIIKDTNYVKSSTIPIQLGITGSDALIQASQVYFFKETYFDNTTNKRNYFTFLDSKFMFQSLAIPLKIRPALSDPKFGNAFPQQVETGFNFGFAAGWKFNKNAYRTGPNLMGLTTNKISISPGLLLNFGSTTLNDKNTRPTFSVERKAFTHTVGLVLMLGFNNINIGVTRATDKVTGAGKSDWVYQGKSWTGLIVGIDLLK